MTPLPPIGLKLDTFTTAVLGFALNEAAFSAEIIRGGILSVNRSQSLAASAFGMSSFLTLRRIILPQAMRAILPGLSNDVIAVLKGTSIASVIFVNELTFRAQQIVGQNFKFFTVFAAAGVIYLIMTSAISAVQAILERRFNLEIDRTAQSEATQRRLFGFGGRRTPTAVATATAAPATLSTTSTLATDHATTQTAWMRAIADATAAGGPGAGSFVNCSNVHKAYGARPVLRGIDLQIKRGEVVVVMGPQRQRQKYAAAPGQPSGASGRRGNPGQRRLCRLPPAG